MLAWGTVLTIFVTSCISFGAQTTVKTTAKYAERGIVHIARTVRHSAKPALKHLAK